MRGVFISYRRDDTAGYAGRLYDALIAHFGRDRVFIDIDSIPPGQDFVDVIEKRIASCTVVLVLMGKGWLNSTDERGHRRLDDTHDFVRLEVASAFGQKIPVIPVLVGGARMPRPADLPEPLAPLAQLNAVEIFDQLFQDSVRHLVNALKPLVAPRIRFWPWAWPVSSNRRLLFLVIALFATVGTIAIIIASLRTSPGHSDMREVTPSPSETLEGPVEPNPPIRVKVKTPPKVTELPPVVQESKSVMLPGSSNQVNGPAKPRISWRAHVTIGDAWHVLGTAADGTLYLYDQEHSEVAAVRDGKEQWAFDAPRPLGFAPDGRLWLGDYDSNYSFNSRGEGGRVTRKDLLPDRATLRQEGARGEYTYACSDGAVYATDSRARKIWSLDLDGNCEGRDPAFLGQTGVIYASSDARTLYAIARDGRVQWTVKQACKGSSVNVYPLPPDDVIVACGGERLYALREGKPLWTAAIGASGGWSWSDIVFDRSGNIYVGVEGPTAMTQLVALDKLGKQIWTVSAGGTTTPEPIGFDAQGRLYVLVSERIVCLSP